MPEYNPAKPSRPHDPDDLRDLFDVRFDDEDDASTPHQRRGEVAEPDVTASSEVGTEVDVTADSNVALEPETGAEADIAWQPEVTSISAINGAKNRWLSVGIPSRPLFGGLPLSRIVPQDIHSVFDYLDGGTVLSGAFMTACRKAQAASWVLGGAGIAASALTDYRLSLAKLVPIEKHEIIDYAFGLCAIGAPFILGYRKTAPHVAMTHIAIGIATLLVSLVTDYRAYRGVGRHAPA